MTSEDRKKQLVRMKYPEIRRRMAQIKRTIGQITPTGAFLMKPKQLEPYERLADEYAELEGELERRKKAKARAKVKRNIPELERARKLWSELGDIPVDESECIELPFLEFQPGTNREEIWHWFEETFPVSVHDLMGMDRPK